MLKAVKENKVYSILEADKDRYRNDGYDIYEDDKLVEYSAKKTVPYEEYKKVKDELDELKAAAPAEADTTSAAKPAKK